MARTIQRDAIRSAVMRLRERLRDLISVQVVATLAEAFRTVKLAPLAEVPPVRAVAVKARRRRARARSRPAAKPIARGRRGELTTDAWTRAAVLADLQRNPWQRLSARDALRAACVAHFGSVVAARLAARSVAPVPRSVSAAELLRRIVTSPAGAPPMVRARAQQVGAAIDALRARRAALRRQPRPSELPAATVAALAREFGRYRRAVLMVGGGRVAARMGEIVDSSGVVAALRQGLSPRAPRVPVRGRARNAR